MAIRLVTLDCANTLLKGSWDPVGFALWAARDAGLCLPARAATAYGELLRRRYPSILVANLTGDYAVVQAEYVRLGEEWLSGLGVDPALAPDVVATSHRLLTTELFELFEDTVPFLKAARARGLRLAVASNWDASLPLVLAAHGLDVLVDEAYASLVVGAEKPDPTMLLRAMESAGVGSEETLHVGDDETDDLGAAANAGVKGVLLTRPPLPSEGGGQGVRGVSSLMEVLDWID